MAAPLLDTSLRRSPTGPGYSVREVSDFSEWRELVSGATVPVVATMDPSVAAFRGTLTSTLVDDVAIVRTRSVAQLVTRTPRACRSAAEPMIKVLVQRSGRALIEQDACRGTVHGGFLTVYDTAVPYTLTQTTDFCADAILIPRDRLLVTTKGLAAAQARPVSLSNGPGGMFLSYLDSLLGQLDACSPNTMTRYSTVLADLLSATLLQTPAAAGSAETMRETAQVWIGRHLADPDLTPAAVAAGTGTSVRYLHRLFEGSGTTVSGYIRTRRLERIRTDLVDPRWSELTVARIGAKWGIPDPAHLSRLFRAEFGRTPGGVRHEASTDGS